MFFLAVEIVDFKATSAPQISYTLDTPIPKKRTAMHPAEANTVCGMRGRGEGGVEGDVLPMHAGGGCVPVGTDARRLPRADWRHIC